MAGLGGLGYLGPVTVEAMDLLIGRKKLSSAGSGGRPATVEMLQFCADNSIAADPGLKRRFERTADRM